MYTVTLSGFDADVKWIETRDGTRFRRGVEVTGVSEETLNELKAQSLGLKIKSRRDEEPAPEPEGQPGEQDNPLGETSADQPDAGQETT